MVSIDVQGNPSPKLLTLTLLLNAYAHRDMLEKV